MIAELTFADVTVDLLGVRAYRAGRDIGLSFKEYRLLLRLLRDAPQAVTVWDLWIDVIGREMPTNPDLWSNTIPVHISRLRDKLEDRALVTTEPYGYVVPHAVRASIALG